MFGHPLVPTPGRESESSVSTPPRGPPPGGRCPRCCSSSTRGAAVLGLPTASGGARFSNSAISVNRSMFGSTATACSNPGAVPSVVHRYGSGLWVVETDRSYSTIPPEDRFRADAMATPSAGTVNSKTTIVPSPSLTCALSVRSSSRCVSVMSIGHCSGTRGAFHTATARGPGRSRRRSLLKRPLHHWGANTVAWSWLCTTVLGPEPNKW